MSLTLPLVDRHYHRKQHDDVPLSSAYAVLEVAVAICLSNLYACCKVAFSLQRGVVDKSVDNLWIV